MRFRARGALHRLLLLFEDEILVSQYGQWILVEGIRRGVARDLPAGFVHSHEAI